MSNVNISETVRASETREMTLSAWCFRHILVSKVKMNTKYCDFSAWFGACLGASTDQ